MLTEKGNMTSDIKVETNDTQKILLQYKTGNLSKSIWVDVDQKSSRMNIVVI